MIATLVVAVLLLIAVSVPLAVLSFSEVAPLLAAGGLLIIMVAAVSRART